MIKDWTNRVHCGNNLTILKEMPSNSVDVVITSPPYWGLRDYKKATDIWDGDPNCEHEWGESYTRHQEAPGKNSLVKQKGLEYTVTTHICTKCGAWRGQLGLEPHPDLYIKHMVQVFREVKRVLKETGSFYLNLGDSYYGGPMMGMSTRLSLEENKDDKMSKLEKPSVTPTQDGLWMQPKQLLLIPTRLAQALQEDGWILRNDIIWSKPNPMPCSVKDRLNNTYEHIFFFVKNDKYYYDLDSIREQPSTGTNYVRRASGDKGNEGSMNRQMNEDISNNPLGKNPGDFIDIFQNTDYETKAKIAEYHIKEIYKLSKIRPRETYNAKFKNDGEGTDGKSVQEFLVSIRRTTEEYIDKHEIKDPTVVRILSDYAHGYAGDPLGKNPGDFFYIGSDSDDVFPITVQPFKDAHFAVFPPELVIKPLKASCPRSICKQCGKPRERITEDIDNHTEEQKQRLAEQRERQKKYIEDGGGRGSVPDGDLVEVNHVTTGWTSCDCDIPEKEKYTPGIVLDPYMGSGTTGLVAKQLGFRWIGIDINPDYCKMAQNRIDKLCATYEWEQDGLDLSNLDISYETKEYEEKKRQTRIYKEKPGETSFDDLFGETEEKDERGDNEWEL